MVYCFTLKVIWFTEQAKSMLGLIFEVQRLYRHLPRTVGVSRVPHEMSYKYMIHICTEYAVIIWNIGAIVEYL